MKEKLIEVLETFCPNDVYLQGTLNPNQAYPQKLITFFVIEAPFGAFYDDDANVINWYINVMFYSNNPQEVLDIPPQIIRALKAENFMALNAGIDVLSDVDTHTGRAIEFIYQEKYTN